MNKTSPTPVAESGVEALSEEMEDAWVSLTELVIEVLEELLRSRKWIPGNSLDNLTDTLNETLLRDRKKE